MSILSKSYPFIKKILFLLPPEFAHHCTLSSLSGLEKIHLLEKISCQKLIKPKRCMGLLFPNSIGLSAGLDKKGNSIDSLGRLGFGFIEVGTFTPKAQKGNPKPRLHRLIEEKSLINEMGFNNPGIEKASRYVAKSKSFLGIIGINIGKNKETSNKAALDDYLQGMQKFYQQADYLVVNLSSPNTPKLRELQEPKTATKLIQKLKEEQKKLSDKFQSYVPLTFKLSPDLQKEEISSLSDIFLKEKIDGIIATNTSNQYPSSLKLKKQSGGLSGKIINEKSTQTIQQFYRHLGKEIPIIASGGIHSAEDAIRKIEAGAELIQIYTGLVYQGPQLIEEIFEALN